MKTKANQSAAEKNKRLQKKKEQFPKMKLLCGEKGLDLEVKGIRIIEIEDIDRKSTRLNSSHT